MLETGVFGSVLTLLILGGHTQGGPAWSIHLLTSPLYLRVPGHWSLHGVDEVVT